MSLIPRRVGSVGWVMALNVSRSFSLRVGNGEAKQAAEKRVGALIFSTTPALGAPPLLI
jgi:hypothetical protein